ncbi:MAG: L-threonine 3-dehydrogenase [Deltaproteobacteria bacterium RIFCSPLOWO2_02_FULL_46_8]|nr:MAG: L-threonine 3-dehydrogenase [Deltaproteobacteria bacterium RIFCSPLOWO2_02_FULL_46_8]
MKVVAKLKAEPGFEYTDLPVPEVTSHRVLVKIKAASICGSDVHLYKWDDWAQKNLEIPRIIGHEGTGEVVEIGSQVKHIHVGDHVSFESHIPCLGCARCRTGEMHLCKELKTIGFGADGCFAEYISIPEICCVKNSKSMPWDIASIQEPLGNSVYAVSESEVAGKQVAVFGDGPTGLFAVAVARCLGATKIFAVGASPFRLNILKQLGPDVIIDATKENPAEIILDQTHGDGVDCIIEMSGAEKAIHAGFRSVRNGGIFTAFGLPSKPIELDFAGEIIFKGIKLIAIHGRKMFDTWKQMGELLESGRLNAKPVITHHFPMSDINKAMDLLTRNPIEAAKIILTPS